MFILNGIFSGLKYSLNRIGLSSKTATTAAD